MNCEEDMGDSLLVETFRDPLLNAASNAYDASDSSNENDFQPTNMTLLDGKFFQHVPERSVGNTQVGICVLCLPKVTEIKGHNKSTSNFVSHLKRRHGPESITAYHKHLQDVKNKRLLQNFQGPRGKRTWRVMNRQQPQPVINPKQWKNGEEQNVFRDSTMNETDNQSPRDTLPLHNANSHEAHQGNESLETDETRLPIIPKVEYSDRDTPQTPAKSTSTAARSPDTHISQQFCLQQIQQKDINLSNFFNCMENTVQQFSRVNQLKAKAQIFSVVSQLEFSELSAAQHSCASLLGSAAHLQSPSGPAHVGGGHPADSQYAPRSANASQETHQDASSSAIFTRVHLNNQNSPESTLNGSSDSLLKNGFSLQHQ